MKKSALPELRGGVVHLKDAELRPGIAIGEGVQARAQQHILIHAFRRSSGELIFRQPAPRSHKSAKSTGIGMSLLFGLKVKALAKNGNSNGIVQDGWLVEKLMYGAADRNAESGAAGQSCFHEDESTARIRRRIKE